jgi:hypothetical protein
MRRERWLYCLVIFIGFFLLYAGEKFENRDPIMIILGGVFLVVGFIGMQINEQFRKLEARLSSSGPS